MSKCPINNCNNKYGFGVHFFCFPKNKERRKLWMDACGGSLCLKTATQGRICAVHFSEDSYRDTAAQDNHMHLYGQKTKIYLKSTAVPTLFLSKGHCQNSKNEIDGSDEGHSCILPIPDVSKPSLQIPEAVFEEIVEYDALIQEDHNSDRMVQLHNNYEESRNSDQNPILSPENDNHSSTNLEEDNGDCDDRNKLMSPGTLVWANCSGWFPALIIQGEDVGQQECKGKLWVYWINDKKLSHVIQKFFKLAPIDKGYAAWILEQLLPFINSGTAVSLYPYPEIIHLDLDNFKSKRSKQITNYYYEAKNYSKNDDQDERDVGVVCSKFKNSNPLHVCVICLKDKNTELLEHPFFTLSVCRSCLVLLKPKLFAIRKNKKCGYCTICGLSVSSFTNKMLYCCNDYCTRVYCNACIQIVCPADNDILESEGAKAEWRCYLCRPPVKLNILPREDWRYRFMSLYWGQEYASTITHKDGFYKPKMRVFSAFDGISTAKLILDQLDIAVETYFASEIDEDALYVSKVHHPDIRQFGDIRDVVKNEKLIEKLCPIHFVIGGSPCEELSKANAHGMGLAEGGSGALVYQMAELMQLIKKYNKGVPFFFVYENVQSMPDDCRTKIERILNCKLRNSDAVNFSPTHRARVIGTNLPWPEHESNNLIVKDLLDPIEHRVANVKKVRTITTKRNSLLQGPQNIFPISYNGKGVYPSAAELHRWMGYPSTYLYVNRYSFDKMLSMIGKGFNVYQFMEILKPLKYLFELKSGSIC